MTKKIALNMFCEAMEGTGKDLEYFVESENGVENYFVEGIFAQADIINGNRRKYPSDVLMPAVEDYIDKRVNRNIAMGELDHPDKLQVSMQFASHITTELRIEGSNVYGRAKILDTPMGEVVKGLMRSGVSICVSTRGAGKAIRKTGYEEMQMYLMTAIDIVSLPSAPDAFVNGVRENLEYMVESNLLSISTADKILKSHLSTADFKRAIQAISSELNIG